MRKCRIFKSGYCEITQDYKKGTHDGIDLTDKGHTFGWLVAHSDGTVVGIRSNCKGFENGSYGNYVKIKHDNNYTLYAHGAYNTVKVKVGDKVTKGQEIMYMGNTGYSFGGHVHFEVRTLKDAKINPTEYLDADLPKHEDTPIIHKYDVGDVVKINGVYISSTSDKKLRPVKSKGTITKIINAKNPYLLDNGNIGWINDDCIIDVANEIFKVGDIVIPTKLVDCYGTKLRQYDKEYIIRLLVNGNASLYAIRDGRYYLWAVLPVSNIRKVR